MATTERVQLIIDLDKIHLVKDAIDVLNELYHATITFSDKTVDGKQCIEVEAGIKELSLVKDYLNALCHPAETAEVHYPVELHGIIASIELRSHIERESKAALHYQEPGNISIRGNDPISVMMAYSMLEDAICEHLDQATLHVSDKPGSSSLDNTIKRVILEVLSDKQENKCSASTENKTASPVESDNGISDATSDSGLRKYLKEFALSKGYDEKKIESIFAYFGHDVKFEIFYRALKDIITIP